MSKIEPRLLQGFFDYSPEEMKIRQHVSDVWRETFERYGYGQLDTPVLEYADILFGKYGEEEKLIYHFNDHGHRHVALRYDHTVPLARYVAQNRHQLTLPFKRYAIGKVWRAEKASKGRKREFYQCDIDIVGTNNLLADAEIISAFNHGFSQFPLPKALFLISHRKILESFLKTLSIPEDIFIEVNRAVDKLDKIGIKGVEEELSKRSVPLKKIPEIISFIDSHGSNQEILQNLKKLLNNSPEGAKALLDLEKLFAYLDSYGLQEDRYRLTPSLVRGLDYYTGIVFEAIIPEKSRSAIAGGGRYDNLCNLFTEEKIPAVGASVGYDRLCMLLEEANFRPQKDHKSILISVFSQAQSSDSIKIATLLRTAGINTELFAGDQKIGQQFKYADKNNIPFVAVLGPDEIRNGIITLKNLKTGAQIQLKLTEIVPKINEFLNN